MRGNLKRHNTAGTGRMIALFPYLIVWVLLLIHQAYHIDVSFRADVWREWLSP